MKYLLLLIIVAGLLSCSEDGSDQNDIVDNSGLVAYFPLDSNYYDESGNEHHLQAHGNPEFTEGYLDEPSSAILMDGKDDFLLGSIGELDTFSISLWAQSYRFYVGEWPRWRSTFFDYSNKQVYGAIDGISGATQIKCGTESGEVAAVDIHNCTHWFHLYIAVSDDMKIYINDSLVTTTPLPGAITYLSDIIYFGRSSTDDEIELTYFYGKLDEIRIFNRILDQSEIDELLINP